ncbi:uncharacterized protein BJ171DRAFT_476625 [Polychytrium aggregatum]|uniref:uncharacterized protein n=1 Tax=Polychytrium aggregatum TaxID=110093 RepID=UPI0022FE3C31|nr:uncharacterized protein BJ171DRAFT_476625 [Polychytrium aggregatum]KAI9202414.1 hypothetical protein BJ171DRAFT_476625 [Polychytrium aggregatum]
MDAYNESDDTLNSVTSLNSISGSLSEHELVSAGGGPIRKRVRRPPPPEKKVYHCTFEGCNRSFHRPDRLESHFMRHSCERPFKCTSCEMSFVSKYDLQVHIRRLHGSTCAYQCHKCGLGFYRAHVHKEHLDVCNGILPPARIRNRGKNSGTAKRGSKSENEHSEEDDHDLE